MHQKQSVELLEGLTTEQSTYDATFFGAAVVTLVTCVVTRPVIWLNSFSFVDLRSDV